MKLKLIIAVVLLMHGFVLVTSPVQARVTGCGGSQVESSGQAGPKPVTTPSPRPSC
jgi:hypothetical protein